MSAYSYHTHANFISLCVIMAFLNHNPVNVTALCYSVDAVDGLTRLLVHMYE